VDSLFKILIKLAFLQHPQAPLPRAESTALVRLHPNTRCAQDAFRCII
jgi:hypothetical protein